MTSADGTKRTCRLCCAMSALGGQAEKHMLAWSFSDFDPLRTSVTTEIFQSTHVPSVFPSVEHRQLYCRVFDPLGRSFVSSRFSLHRGYLMTLSNVTRRGMIGGLAAGAGAATVISSDTFISGARAQSARKNFLFRFPVPSCGAWCWSRVSDRLEKQGHKLYPLTFTGLGRPLASLEQGY